MHSVRKDTPHATSLFSLHAYVPAALVQVANVENAQRVKKLA